MPAPLSRADSLREYLTGATSDGGTQADPSASLGHYRSSTEALSYGITIGGSISGVVVTYASGGNPVGIGTLTAIDTNNLTWRPFGASGPGPAASFSGTSDIKIVEAASNAGQYLRITGSTPFSIGACTISLAYLVENQFGFDNVAADDALAGISEYRASIIRNESPASVDGFQRWIATYGTSQLSNSTQLGSSGAGTITTTGSFADWPATGWCQIRTSGGLLREIVYYSARTNTTLTVPAAGRALLGSTAAAGASSDNLYAVPGIGLAIDTAGVQASGSSIQTIASAITPPTSVTWNFGITAISGLQVAGINSGQQVGIWVWRQIPAGTVATPLALTQTKTSFNAL